MMYIYPHKCAYMRTSMFRRRAILGFYYGDMMRTYTAYTLIQQTAYLALSLTFFGGDSYIEPHICVPWLQNLCYIFRTPVWTRDTAHEWTEDPIKDHFHQNVMKHTYASYMCDLTHTQKNGMVNGRRLWRLVCTNVINKEYTLARTVEIGWTTRNDLVKMHLRNNSYVTLFYFVVFMFG